MHFHASAAACADQASKKCGQRGGWNRNHCKLFDFVRQAYCPKFCNYCSKCSFIYHGISLISGRQGIDILVAIGQFQPLVKVPIMY